MSRLKKIFFLLCATAHPTLGLAESEYYAVSNLADPDRNLIESIGLMLHSSAVEGANSHGQIGGSLGIGLRQPKPTSRAQDAGAEFGNKTLQLHVVKGMNGPFDFGFSFSNSEQGNGSALTGYLQWTVFEEFRMPSAALRIGHGSTFGYEFMSINRSSADAIVSYEIFHFFGVYAAVGMSFTQARYDLERSVSGLSLARGSGKLVETKSVHSAWQDQHHSFGVSIKAMPPFFSINAELTRNDRDMQSISAKLAVGM